MHILAFILMFVVGAIVAACDGDFSGIAAIGKFVGGAILQDAIHIQKAFQVVALVQRNIIMIHAMMVIMIYTGMETMVMTDTIAMMIMRLAQKMQESNIYKGWSLSDGIYWAIWSI